MICNQQNIPIRTEKEEMNVFPARIVSPKSNILLKTEILESIRFSSDEWLSYAICNGQAINGNISVIDWLISW